jgi:hypothetical protein
VSPGWRLLSDGSIQTRMIAPLDGSRNRSAVGTHPAYADGVTTTALP